MKIKMVIYKKARDEYFDKINSSKDSIELNYSYNSKYHSYQLIEMIMIKQITVSMVVLILN
jgi:hypothetical protein